MSTLSKTSILLIALTLLLVLGLSAVPAFANSSFDLYVNHDINGRSIGLDKELPVDVFINGGYAFTFGFGETISTQLPADTYQIDVKLANTNVLVMSLEAVDIPADADVTIHATLGADQNPTLRANIQ